MRIFEHFVKGQKCLLCGTEDDKECTLIPIDGTKDGNNCQAVPIHTDCIKNIDLRYNKEANIFYKVAIEL